ncbi:hypothetical protein BVRB_6g137440 [Beta vulgaris subsp. vulgaris]|nr:hypothetical protein BVRB_6g137440 [Beta vulgaris subsp. vulgaris]
MMYYSSLFPIAHTAQSCQSNSWLQSTECTTNAMNSHGLFKGK